MHAAKCKMIRAHSDSNYESVADLRPAWDVYDKHVCDMLLCRQHHSVGTTVLRLLRRVGE